jgi:hypothetical protein
MCEAALPAAAATAPAPAAVLPNSSGSAVLLEDGLLAGLHTGTT